ncbi:MAG TPA: MBL fold metallo-hydrolase [Caldilineae bacterium]|nr:MBL fold metallo-hydrolase [Caldilineae bacterium]
MRPLADRLWWVDEVAAGAGVYLWQDEQGLILFDTGTPWHAHAILRTISREGFDPSRIHHIMITHADMDHIGGLRTLREASQARIVCHAVTGAILQGRLHRPLGLGLVGRLIAGPSRFLMKTVFRCIPIEADDLIVGDRMLPGGFQAIFTPGHCPGHTSYYHPETRVLITGDAIHNRARMLGLPPALLLPDRAAAVRSVEKLARLDVGLICFGHGEPITEGASAQLRALAQRLQAAVASQPG